MRPLSLLAVLLLAACPAAPPPVECVRDSECLPGERCLLERCLPSACGDRPCRKGEACIERTCRAADCAAVQCPLGQSCAKGKCYPVDCGDESCSLGDVCVQQGCSEPSCVGVTCGTNEACAADECRPTVCAGVTCAKGDVCEDGRCVSTRCVGVVCSSGTVCADGRCVPNACDGVSCEAAQACVEGACIDAACVNRVCPAGKRCQQGACLACPAFETSCGDAKDDDCDGKTDCADGDCEELSCGEERVCLGASCVAAAGADAGRPGRDAGRADAGCSGRDCGGKCVAASGCCAVSDCALSGDDCAANECRCGGGDRCSAAEVCQLGTCRAGCVVAGAFYQDGEPDPADPCSSCQPSLSTSEFSPRADGASCGAGRVCVTRACLEGCWIDGGHVASGTLNPADPYQACIPEISTTAWTDSEPRPDSWFAKVTSSAYGCGMTQASGAAACVAQHGVGWSWPDVSLGLHGAAYEAAKREAPGVGREYVVYGTDAVPGYYFSTVDSAEGSAGRGSTAACPAQRKLLCARPAHSPFQVTGAAWQAGSTIAFDPSHLRFAVFYVTDGASGSRQLRLQLLTSKGALVRGPVTLAGGFGDLNGGTTDAPRIHADFEPADQRYRVFYSKGVEANGKYSVYAMTLDQEGATVLPEHVVESGIYDLNNAFDVAVDRANRRYLLAYAFSDLTTYAVRVRYVGADDVASSAIDLETNNFNVSTLAATFAARSGSFFIAYPSKSGSGVTVKVLASGASAASSTGSASTGTPSRLRLAASANTSTPILAYVSAGAGNVNTQLLSSTGAASGSPLRVNAFAGEASAVRGLELACDGPNGRYLVAYDGYVQALTEANVRSISLVEESIAGGQSRSGVVQGIAFALDNGGRAVILHGPGPVGVGLQISFRESSLDLY
ncbi:MAG: hypothetical protein QM765_52365 [Myxococcales bacterium]